jgi:hypothetical protein
MEVCAALIKRAFKKKDKGPLSEEMAALVIASWWKDTVEKRKHKHFENKLWDVTGSLL